MSTILRQVLGIGAAATAYWLCRESYRGNVGKWETKFQSHEADAMYDYTKYGWGHYSGNPQMDHWSHQLFGVKLFGVFGSKVTYNHIKTYVDGFVNDVLLRNFVPIAVGVGGLYAAFGQALNRPFIALGRMLTTPTSVGSAMRRGLGQMARGATWLLGQGVNGAVNLLARGGWGSAALAAVTALGLYRFYQVHNHIEQHEFFRDEVSIKGH